MAKVKKETRGRKTALQEVEEALGAGSPVPVGYLPIPERLKRELAGRDTQDILRLAAPFCAQYLLNCVFQKGFKPSWARIDVAKFVIEQVHGKARIKAELTGAGGTPLTWQMLVILAEKAEETGQFPDLSKLKLLSQETPRAPEEHSEAQEVKG